MTSPSAGSSDARAAFAELGQLVLAEHDLDSVMDTVAQLAKQVVPGADAVSVTFLDDRGATTVAASDQLARDLDERQYDRGFGPCLDSIASGLVIEIADLATDRRWPEFADAAQARGAGSSLSVPVPVRREVNAALNLYGVPAKAFGPESRELATTFAAYAGVALANMHLFEVQSRTAEQLQEAMTSRSTIDQAIGIVMHSRRCTAAEAFDVLVELSQRSNRKLRHVAEVLVREATGQP